MHLRYQERRYKITSQKIVSVTLKNNSRSSSRVKGKEQRKKMIKKMIYLEGREMIPFIQIIIITRRKQN